VRRIGGDEISGATYRREVFSDTYSTPYVGGVRLRAGVAVPDAGEVIEVDNGGKLYVFRVAAARGRDLELHRGYVRTKGRP
jgi:hypothetical protein